MLIYLCEDTKSDLLRLQHYLGAYARQKQIPFQLQTFSSGRDLLSAYREARRQPELIFLDIFMDDSNGMDTAKELRQIGYDGGLIFTTSSMEHAVDSYEVNALFYLHKPYDHEQFELAMERCTPIFRKAQEKFTFRYEREPMSVPYADIVFFETGPSHTVILHAVHGTFSFSGTLSQVNEQFQDNANFLRIGRSFLINLNHVAKNPANDLIMSDGSIVQIPVRSQTSVRAAVAAWQRRL
ncbi:MAG: LytR/AlgR family response regulator transcription factor [Anaerovoracaceae bacterium]|jgi:two-component system response regulator LytT